MEETGLVMSGREGLSYSVCMSVLGGWAWRVESMGSGMLACQQTLAKMDCEVQTGPAS